MVSSEVYEKFKIPSNLRRHMMMVAGVGKIIGDGYMEKDLNIQLVVKVLLVHDLGNIIKFKLESVDLLDKEDIHRLDELKAIKESFIAKYGNDCDLATQKMMEELGCSKEMISLCQQSHGNRVEAIVKSDDYEEKICMYADMRVAPFGVISLEERFRDLRKRYQNEKARMNEIEIQCRILEQQIQSRVNFDLNSLDSYKVSRIFDSLGRFPLI